MKAHHENSTVIASPCHGRRVRVPTDRGALDVRCPACSRPWRWSPGTDVTPPRPRREVTRVSDSQPEPRQDHREPQPRHSLVATFKEKFALVLPEWFAAPHGFGQMIPRVDTTPEVAELHVLDMVCSHTRRRFRQTFAKTRLGEPFRLVDNGDAKSYRRLARANGSRITKGIAGSAALSDFDWSNWQCQHCGHGVIAGDAHNFFFCGACDTLNCASSMQYPRNAQATALCASCGNSNVVMETLDKFPSTRRMAYNDKDKNRDKNRDKN